MPSFIPRNLAMQQMPITSPDYIPAYSSNACGGMQYLPPPPPYSAHPTGTMRSENVAHGYADRYSQQQTQAPATYHQHHAYLNPPPGLPIPNGIVAAPRLPPIQTYPPSVHRKEPTFLPEPAPSANEDKAVGGVSARLDYDLEMMADFVTKTSHNLVAKWLPRKGMAQPLPSSTYRKWVLQVLSATRLPSSTLFLSLYYLSKRVAALGSESYHQFDEHAINRILTVALIIGSKFFDDNTFINRSWSEVSGIDVKYLNQMEREWLLSIGYHLHLDEEATESCNRLRNVWDEYVLEQNRERTTQAMKLSPIETSFHHASSHMTASTQSRMGFNQNRPFQDYRAPAQQSYYPSSASAQYNNPWNRTDDSPASAPHTGPATPEYYGLPAAANWGTMDSAMDRSYSYDRRTMFYGRQPQPQSHAQPSMSNTHGYRGTFSPHNSHNNHNYGWSTHGLMCNCSFCAGGRNVPYYNNWAPQVVAG
jgi:hypothetical protein